MPRQKSISAIEAEGSRSAETSTLDEQDIKRLANFKVRHALETRGFSPAQAQRLVFLKWMYTQESISG